MINPYWITTINECKIGISPCPIEGPNLKAELGKIVPKESGIIISLLPEDEAKNLELEDEKLVCESVGIDFLNFPIKDMSIPGFNAFYEFIDQLYSKTNDVQSMIIHCRAGIGRSSLIIIGLMIKNGSPIIDSIEIVSAIRGYSVPQSFSQRKLLSKYFEIIRGNEKHE